MSNAELCQNANDSGLPTRQLENFEDISSVLFLSSPSRLDLPEIYNVAKESLNSFFPHVPTPRYKFGQSEEGLILAIEHDVKPVSSKALAWVPFRYAIIFCLRFLIVVLWDYRPLEHTASSVHDDVDPEDVILHLDRPQRRRR